MALEPINESDLDTKEKFLGGEKNSSEIANSVESNKTEAIPAKEQAAEQKEGAAEKETAYSKIMAKIPATLPTVPKDEEVASDAINVNEGKDAESKITNLVSLAEAKGVPHAVKVARHMEDNYTLDEFHDRLLGDELHDALMKKGLIKEI
jgi:hypothetical protein